MFGSKAGPGDRVRVKICGITNEADALAAIKADADALGFNLVRQSKRYIDIQAAAGWIDKLPKEICKVAVLVNPSWDEAFRISQLSFIDALQLHGDESPEFCRRLAEAGIRFAKALPVEDSKSLLDVPGFSTDTIILDSSVKQRGCVVAVAFLGVLPCPKGRQIPPRPAQLSHPTQSNQLTIRKCCWRKPSCRLPLQPRHRPQNRPRPLPRWRLRR